MDMKKLLTGTIVGGIVLYAAGWLIWDVLFADFYAANAGSAENLWRDAPIMWAGIAGMLPMAALVTMALGKCENASIHAGIKVGAIIGGLAWLSVNLLFYSLSNMNELTLVLVDPILEAVRTGLAGAAIVVVLGMTAGSGSTDY